MYLMSKDTVIAEINFDTGLYKVIRPDLLPLDLRGDNIPIFNIPLWFNDRVLSISRSNAKVILDSVKLEQNDRIKICLACRALSLDDCYWLKFDNDTLTWKDVNLYHNSLSNGVAKVALTGKWVSLQGKIVTPELTGLGSFAKCWRRFNNQLYLYKSGSNNGLNNEAKIEVLVSDILDVLNVEHVKYTLTELDGRVVSKCKCLTDENISMTDMLSFSNYCGRNNINIQQWLLKQQLYYEMIVIDYLVLNTDRHLGNWGVLFDANTGKVLRLRPLFDHNLAFNKYGDINSKVIHGKTLQDAAHMAKLRCNLDYNKLYKFVKARKQRFKKIFNSEEEYNDTLKRIKEFLS